jgi:hypothetical protein
MVKRPGCFNLMDQRPLPVQEMNSAGVIGYRRNLAEGIHRHGSCPLPQGVVPGNGQIRRQPPNVAASPNRRQSRAIIGGTGRRHLTVHASLALETACLVPKVKEMVVVPA